VDLPGVPEFQSLADVKRWLENVFAGQYSGFGRDIETELRKPLKNDHGSLLIPAVTIDAAHSQVSLTAATAAAQFARFKLQNTGTSTSASAATAVDYVGRGVLTKFGIAEVTAGATTARTFGAKITLDGNVIYDVSNALTRESAVRIIVGNAYVDVNDTSFGWFDEVPGLPFNSSCKLEYTSDGTRTLTAAWKIAKKL
jgi:hypothetical protein